MVPRFGASHLRSECCIEGSVSSRPPMTVPARAPVCQRLTAGPRGPMSIWPRWPVLPPAT